LLLLLLLPPLQPKFGTSRQFFIVVSNPKHPTLCVRIRQFVSDGAGLFGTLAPMLRIVDGNFWLLLLLLLLLLQPKFGTSRQFLIIASNPKHPTLCVRRQFVSDGAGLFGTLAPMLRIVDRDFGHGYLSIEVDNQL